MSSTPNTASPNFQVDVNQIRRHSAAVRDIASGLSSVAGGLSGSLTGNSLGTFVQFLTAGLQSAMTTTTGALTRAASTMDDVGGKLARTADHYQNTDQSNAARLSGVEPR